MKKIKTTGIIVLTLLLLTPFLASSAGAVDVIRNGGFSGGIGEWNINPDIDPTWNPLSDSGVTLSPGGTSYDFNGTVIYQNLNVTGIAGSRFSFSMDLFKSNESDGNTISVILTYVDNANNVHGKKIINPSDVDISSDSANPSRVDGNYTFPASARKLVKIEIAKDGYGNFKTDNISLTTDAAVDLGPIPAVRGLSVNKGDYGDPITILGGSFGTTQGLVFIGGSSDGVGVTAWSDTSITAIISEPVRSGRVYVIADYVESNIAAESFTVTSPHFTVYVMDHDVKVIKGETAEFVVAVDFKNEFTTTGITFSVTGLNGSIPVFTPSSLATQGGTLLRIDTGGLTAGTHQLLVNAFKDGSATPYCSVPVGLEVITVSDIKLYKYGADSKKIYFDGDAVTLTEQGETRIYFDVIDSHGEIVQTWPSPAVLNSSDPAKLAVYPDKWAGYLIYAVDSGSASLTATAPDGFKKSLSVNNNFTQLITGMGISPGSISNTNTDIVTFSAHSTEPFSWAGYSGDVVLNDDDDIDWSDSNKTVVRTFTVNQAQSSMGTSLFYAGTNSAGRAVPFTITNDSSYSAISGGVRVVDSNLLPYDVEWFDLEFYNIDGTLSFTREAGSPHGGGDFTLGAIEPGTYKVRFVAHGNVKPQWWPNADDTVKAQPLTFTAGGSVDNIYFFAESGSTISGSVAMNNYPGGSILIRAFTDEALTQLAMETKIYWAPGAFTIEGLEPGTYYVMAVLDVNDNGQPDNGEPAANAGVFPVVVEEKSEANVGIINLGDDGGALSGTVQLGTNTIAEGTVYVGVFSDAGMTEVAGGAILDAPGIFTIKNLPPGTYYVGAYMDVNGDNSFPSEPGKEDPIGDAIGNPVTITTGTTADAGTITLTKTSQTDFSFTGAVVFSDNSSAVGATVEMAGNSSLSTTTANDGTFTLADIPISTTFSLKVSKEGYANTYTGIMLSGADIEIVEHPFILFTSGEFSDWGVTTGKGIILSKVMNRADGKYIGGATVSCVSGQGKNYTIGYFNEAGFPDKSLTSTSSNGRFFIFDVEEGDRVLVIAQMAGWAFDVRVFMTHGDSVSMSYVSGTTNADQVAIHTRLQAVIDEYNAKNLSGFMAYISESYLDDGMNRQGFISEVQEDMTDPNFEQHSYMVLNTAVDGDRADVFIVWSWGGTETLHFIKENGAWMMYGNQEKYEVDAWSQNWKNGTQYMVQFEVKDPSEAASSVMITGPGITDPLILGYDAGKGSWNSWHEDKSLNFESTPPAPPLTYTITITHSSGTTDYYYTVHSFVSVSATNLSPSGTAPDPLVFSWTGAGAGYKYQVQLSDADWNRVWDSDWVSVGTSIGYDGQPLTPDATYHYLVVTKDMYGNQSFAEGSFTQPAALGDINGDHSTNLADGILALQVMAGMNPEGIRSGYAESGADVNGDGRIGIAEVVYILQYVAGLKQ